MSLVLLTWRQITLALVPIVPIIGLLIYDLTLWFWRLLGASYTSYTESRQRKAEAHRALANPTVPTSDKPSQQISEKGET